MPARRLDFGLGALDFGLGALDFGLGALDFGLGALDFGLGALDDRIKRLEGGNGEGIEGRRLGFDPDISPWRLPRPRHDRRAILSGRCHFSCRYPAKYRCQINLS